MGFYLSRYGLLDNGDFLWCEAVEVIDDLLDLVLQRAYIGMRTFLFDVQNRSDPF